MAVQTRHSQPCFSGARSQPFGPVVLVCLCLLPALCAQAQLPYVERQVSFPTANTQVGAILCLPTSPDGKVAIVILMRGSGPLESDQNSGTDDPFRNLARGLARVGIATLDYQEHAIRFDGKPKLLDRTVSADAIAALRFAATLPEINPSAEFVLGHSVGGTMAPYVAEAYPQLRGVILAGAAIAPIDRSILRQHGLRLAGQGKSEREIQNALNSQAKILADVRSGKLPSTRMINGAPVAYWLDWMSRDPIGELEKLKLPVLVLQGESDTPDEADSERLQKEIEKLGPRAEVHWIPDLNRYFSPPQGKHSSAYSSVDQQAVESIAKWVARNARTPKQ